MDNNNRNNTQYNDSTGEVISWVIVFILMFAFWPVGLFLLFRKLRGYAKPASGATGRASSQAAYTARQSAAQPGSAYGSDWTASQTSSAQQAPGQQASGQRASAQQSPGQQASGQQSSAQQSPGQTDFEAAARHAATQASSFAREVGGAARQAAREIETAARQAMSQHTGYVKPPVSKNSTNAKQSASKYTGYVKQPSAQTYTYNYNTRHSAQSPQKKASKRKDRTRLEKKSGKFVSVVLLIIAIALFAIGANTIARAAQDIWGAGVNSWRDLWMGAFYFIGAFISFFSRNIGVRRFSRYKKYYAFVADRGIVPISDIVRVAGRSERAVVRDIQAMVSDGYFGPEAYIDSELDSLVLRAEAAKDARNAIYNEPQQPLADDKPENQYMAIILELRALNDTIIDYAISDKIDRIEELTAKIFRIVEDNPSKLPQIKRFMNYYLPTTLKLLHSYALLEKQGIKGENITAAKENISRILDTLATGYEQQLDQLFKSDVIDIEVDINVLENLMQQDGLTDGKVSMNITDEPKPETGEKQELQVMEGTM